MRQSLLKTFDEIFLIDLHGNSLKKEKTPDGDVDENVFDIRQGTAIIIMIKKTRKTESFVMHHEMYGSREEKYRWLERTKFKKNTYGKISPESPYYFLKPQNTGEIMHFRQWPSISEIFPVNSVGVVTARDHLAIQWTPIDMLNIVRNFQKLDIEIARQAYELGPDARDWQVDLAQKDIKATGVRPENIVSIYYRPFDYRFTYYTGNSRGFHCMPRREVMQHMLKPNISLSVSKRVEGELPFSHVLISDHIVTHHTVSLKEVNYLFPLYLYKPAENSRQSQTMMLFEPEIKYDSKSRIPNISKDLIGKLEKAYKKEFQSKDLTPEHILYYCYGLLYSNVYREKFAEFLRIDFPRIPFTSKYKLFSELASLGEQLSDLHLLKHKALNKPIAKYKGKGDNRVEKVRYDEERQVVFINANNYFEGVSPELWNYQIGGYQVLEKYLKDRKGRIIEDPVHYCKIVTSLHETVGLQKTLDKLFPQIEESAL